MQEIVQFPSVIESNNVDLKNVAQDLSTGLKIFHEGQGYIIGNLALSEGVSPHKNINSAPDDVDYRLLLKSSLLIANQKLGNPITVTTGFPFSTFQLYRDASKNLITGEHEVEFDAGTFGGGSRKKVVVEVDNVYVMPEVVGCALGLRHAEQKQTGNFFMLSLGYGTFEAILSTEGGIVQRSAVSTYGIRYAVNLLTRELSKTHYLDLKTEHQIDVAFSKGFIFLNRKRIDLTELKKMVIKQYYDDVVSPSLRKAFTDADFGRSNKLFLAGGGAMYPELVELFKQEFEGIVEVIVPEDPASLAARGYCHNSYLVNGGDKSKAVGIDIGNSNTVLATFEKESYV
ncbi:hypothetical protein [Penaeicola halotolerans]|uniref:ParM/StbA family protein n=1 Tax=Penaeicola halotolerans TaxID=2793196 RepID=UPI001CF81049|nr:hypothetical protein [Penaeicola halotolerans]